MSKVALNIFNLRKGDILLTSMTDDMSLSIQKMIGSKYTHACLYLGDASFIEATLDGVNYFSPLYFVFDNIDDIKILRLNYSQYKNIDEILNKIDLAARDFSFRKYAQLTALKAGRMKEAEILGKSNIDQVAILSGWEKTVHCSQLVSLAYNIGGKIQLSNTKKPENITPPDLIASTFLIDVTNEVTFQIDEVTELEAKSYPYSPENSILTKQMIVTQQALKGMSQT
ncbi:MAG TPA: hypothetical protein PLB11_09145, partial [Flavobacterium sp.]|nr:hypothetical protein [Flavobacterium sp.]